MWKYYLLRVCYLLLRRLSLRSLYGIARVAGDGAYLLRAPTRKAVMANMRQVMGPEASEQDVRRAARDVFRNVTRYYADLAYAPNMDVHQFAREGIEMEGVEYLKAAQEAGRGAVVVSGHFGNPEMATHAVAAYGIPVFALTEALQPPVLAEFLYGLRSAHGHDYRGISIGAIKDAMKWVKKGGVLAILIDRDVGATGVPMEFCGADAKIPLGAMELALRTGADLIPAWAWRVSGYRFRAQIGPPMELERTGNLEEDARVNTRRFLALLEERLRGNPGQWAVLERIWPEEDRSAIASR